MFNIVFISQSFCFIYIIARSHIQSLGFSASTDTQGTLDLRHPSPFDTSVNFFVVFLMEQLSCDKKMTVLVGYKSEVRSAFAWQLVCNACRKFMERGNDASWNSCILSNLFDYENFGMFSVISGSSTRSFSATRTDEFPVDDSLEHSIISLHWNALLDTTLLKKKSGLRLSFFAMSAGTAQQRSFL